MARAVRSCWWSARPRAARAMRTWRRRARRSSGSSRQAASGARRARACPRSPGARRTRSTGVRVLQGKVVREELKRMSNAKTVQKLYEAFGRGDMPAILEMLAEDVQWESWSDNSAQNAGVPWFELKQGRDGVLEFFQMVGGWEVRE